MVTIRLDYCNSLLYGIADKEINGLQLVQNWLARVLTRSPPRTRSVPQLHKLHWLPVNFRVQFKINLLTFKTISTAQPVYLYNDLLCISQPSRFLRKNKGKLLSVPRIRSKTGARAFSSSAPTLWNSLPCHFGQLNQNTLS